MNHDPSSLPDDKQPEDSPMNPGKNDTPFAGSSVREAIEELSRSLRNVLNAGSREARRAIDEAIPKTKEDLAKGINDIAYAIAYTAAFGNVLAREITPENLRDSFHRGAQSGQSAAEKMLRQRREKAEREARDTPHAESDSGTVWT